MTKRRKTLLSNAFKVKAEQVATDMRSAIGLARHAPLCAFRLADFMGIPVKSIHECGFPDDGERYDDWSAALVYKKSGKPVIIHNKTHSLARQQSDLMHEISHHYCGHPLIEHPLGFLVPASMLTVSPQHEEEAEWLGATLQLPRVALSWAIQKQRMTIAEIAEMYVASQQMVRYRINMTGFAKVVK